MLYLTCADEIPHDVDGVLERPEVLYLGHVFGAAGNLRQLLPEDVAADADRDHRNAVSLGFGRLVV